MKIHEKYMKRCLQLAQNGLGSTYPNPMVGSVIVLDNKIIGEGWHKKAGEPHAEVNAISQVADEALLQKATIYVSLEPCSHYGKTPPCSDLIIAKGIKKVVIGCVDPFAEVSGRGIKKLLDAGCEVLVGVLDKEAQTLNKRFITYHTLNRPYIFLKWAQSQDGYIAPLLETRKTTAPVWITNPVTKKWVHRLRAEEQAILVGTHTVLQDNPSLTTRVWQGPSPLRVVIDKKLTIPKSYNIYDDSVKTLIITEIQPDTHSYENTSFEVVVFDDKLPQTILEILFQKRIQSLIIEGGAYTLQQFIKDNLWDEAFIFTGTKSLETGIKGPVLNQAKLIQTKTDTGDQLTVFKNTKND